MSNQKRKNKKIRNGIIIGIVALLVISYFVSQNDKKVDPIIVESVEVSEPQAHIKGDIEAPLTLVEYSDFQCPACASASPQILALVDQFEGQFNLEYRHFPLRSIHPNAQEAAQAAEAAGMQGKFWEMHDVLFEKQDEWSQSFNPTRYFKTYAEELGLNAERLVFDLESDKIKEIVNAQFDEATELQLPGTPSFVFNGEQIDVNTFIAENLALEAVVVEEEITE